MGVGETRSGTLGQWLRMGQLTSGVQYVNTIGHSDQNSSIIDSLAAPNFYNCCTICINASCKLVSLFNVNSQKFAHPDASK